MTAIDRRAFAEHHRKLLQLERAAEVAEAERLLQTRSDAELVARGVTLLRLEVEDLEPGFGGRLHARLRPSRGDQLPANRFGPGDVVLVRASREVPDGVRGVLVRARRDHVTIALDDDDVELPSLCRLDRMVTDVTFRRLDAALRDLQRDAKGERARFLDVMFGARDIEPPVRREGDTVEWFDTTLDASQRDAVATALDAEPIGLIHGPPGTGKTTAVVELIRQIVRRGERVLACAPSNVAVDNLAERLVSAGLRAVRLGHPARVHANVRDVSLAQLVADAPEQKLMRDARRELDQLLRRMHRQRDRRERAALRDDARRLRGELRQLEGAVTRGFVDGAEVVLATTTGAADELLLGRGFDRVVIDEAGQALEAACWIALRHADRVVLAGDHRQLPPTILSEAAARDGLAATLFERLADDPRTATTRRMLTSQYRMHRRIMAWSAATMYEGRLEAAPAVASHLLTDLPGVVAGVWTSEPLHFVDTAGCGHDESTDGDEESKHNPGEADLVVRIVTELREAAVPDSAIAIVTPYNAQVQRLRQRFGDCELEIGTVDGLQGREKEAVIVSLVRSNEHGQVGFLAELRRLNVALTRARRFLTVIGDSATLAHDRDLCALVEHLQANACYRSAFELG